MLVNAGKGSEYHDALDCLLGILELNNVFNLFYTFVTEKMSIHYIKGEVHTCRETNASLIRAVP